MKLWISILLWKYLKIGCILRCNLSWYISSAAFIELRDFVNVFEQQRTSSNDENNGKIIMQIKLRVNKGSRAINHTKVGQVWQWKK